ncbi:MAG: decarboxylating NADP(+)-dependent phosphogluconate dehydrogenase [Deinococcales bacterium]
MDEQAADIGLIGLAVMGQNLVLNMEDHGFRVAVYNRTHKKTEDFLAGPARGRRIRGAASLEELVAGLVRPRRVMLMVQAGKAVDAVLEQLTPLLEAGDIVIDGGNSFFEDTIHREQALRARGLHYLGTGVSGGEEGARHGPSIMPGGPREAWEPVRPILQAIAAQVDGEPCCDWLGEDGAGHFVKMVHNGIEYGDMQLIAEAYDLLRHGVGLTPAQLQEVFAAWNGGDLDSYLIEITRDILGTYDADGRLVLDVILDAAGQKGTGRWTAVTALHQGIPLTLVTEAVFARSLSALKEERVAASEHLPGPDATFQGERERFVEDVGRALYAAKIASYAQGFMLLSAAAAEHGWSLDLGKVAMMWRGGCIIRSRFLRDIRDAYAEDPALPNLMLAPYFREAVVGAQEAWRRVVAEGARLGIAMPAFSAALSFYDGYRRGRLPANLIQAQRDFFGAHTFERVDRPRGEFSHYDWTGHGIATSGSYQA